MAVASVAGHLASYSAILRSPVEVLTCAHCSYMPEHNAIAAYLALNTACHACTLPGGSKQSQKRTGATGPRQMSCTGALGLHQLLQPQLQRGKDVQKQAELRTQPPCV